MRKFEEINFMMFSQLLFGLGVSLSRVIRTNYKTLANPKYGLLRYLILAVTFALLSGYVTPVMASDVEALGYLPVQDAGRVKPYESFARETLQLLYGSEEYQGRSAVEIVMTWMLVPEHWNTRQIIQISHRGLKEALKLDPEQKYFSAKELFASERLSLVMQELVAFRESKEKPDPYFQAVQRLEGQIGLFQAIKSGEMPRVAPPKIDPSNSNAGAGNAAAGNSSASNAGAKWRNIAELDGELRDKFAGMTRAFVHSLPIDNSGAGAGANSAADQASDQLSLQSAVADFKSVARNENPEVYPSDRIINTEVHYKKLHPFKWSWILYLVSTVVMALAWQSGRASLYRFGWMAAGAAFLIHTYGFALRVYLAGRPPVSNMYESVIWVSWGTIVFAMLFESIYRRRIVLLSGTAVGVLCLVAADLAPAILDSSIQPLEPVLRSNLWLTVHVLTITISYSAFFLAWSLGNLGLFFIFKGGRPTEERVRDLVQSLYRALQVGVVLLAAGIILGGIWADYSWGRFWGWDPKETWALIALLGYLAMLHGRLVGMIQNFGMMVAAVISFNLVIMAWYGVNYVLGAGLHSYGFGAGGVQYVGAFVILDLIYVGYISYVYRSTTVRLRSGSN
jgi:cytochrome c-type biogenesis protein CcsB